MMQVLTDDEVMQLTVDDSFRNFHSKGLDYVCLHRSHELTVKAYFFDEANDRVVHPHDHRYDFSTEVLKGRLVNEVYTEEPPGVGWAVQKFAFHTPLRGSGRFEWQEELGLRWSSATNYVEGSRWVSAYDEIHTLSNVRPGTVLLLQQYVSNLPRGEPTYTYCEGMEPPSLDGLYEKHTPDQVVTRLLQLEMMVPGILQRYGKHGIAKVPFDLSLYYGRELHDKLKEGLEI